METDTLMAEASFFIRIENSHQEKTATPSVARKWYMGWSKSDREVEIPYNIPCMWNLKENDVKQIRMDTTWWRRDQSKKTLSSQSNIKKEKQSWRNQPPWLQTTLQSYSHQDSMELTQKQKYRPMEQDRWPRDEPMDLWETFLKKRG